MRFNDNLLRGWKAIEAELKMTRKAIIDCGYPIRREVHTDGTVGNVYAFKDELMKFARSSRTKNIKRTYSPKRTNIPIHRQALLPL